MWHRITAALVLLLAHPSAQRACSSGCSGATMQKENQTQDLQQQMTSKYN
jgi:hypothetical protein